MCLSGNTWQDKSNVLIYNGHCNDETNNEACDYDGGDCCKNVNTEHCSECKCFHQETCAANPGFLPLTVQDGYCNDETNNRECQYDGGDCCSPNINTEFCSECICYMKETCKASFIPSLVGDGICHDDTNNDECNYDGGDCCLSNENTEQCFWQETCRAGVIPSSVGDGVCNDEANNAECLYDGGDCCGYEINTGQCTECRCLHQETCSVGFHPLIGDGFCNDDTNNAECTYDGGDCCILPVNKDHCFECACHSKLSPFQ